MESTPIGNNQTEVTFAFRKKYRSCVLYDRTQGIVYLICGVLFIAAGFIAYFYAVWCALCLAVISLCLMWLRPILEYSKRVPWTGNQNLSFYEREFTVNGTCYCYSSLRQITFLKDWILLELPNRRILIEAKGFDTCTKEGFFWFMRQNFPAIPIKQRESAVRQYLLMGVTIALCMFSLFVCFGVKYWEPAQEENENVSLVSQSEEPSESVERLEELTPALPEGHTDFGLFSMELPDGFTLLGEGPKYYKRSEDLIVLVRTFPKVMYEESTVEEFAKANSITAETTESFSISPAGNPYFIIFRSEQPDFLANWYSVFFEAEYYYFTIFFGSREVDFETYLPEFQRWEATVNIYEATGMFYSELEEWETEQLILTAPVHMGIGEATNIDYYLAAPDDMSIYTRSFPKSEHPEISDIETFRDMSFRDAPDAIYGTSSGNLYCIYNGSGTKIFSVILENEDSYLIVYYDAPAELFDAYLPFFEEWQAQIVVK